MGTKPIKKLVITVVAVLLVVVLGIGGYLQLYKPSQRDILSDTRKPLPASQQEMLPVTPVSQLPEPYRTRFSDALHDAVHAIKPDHHVIQEQMYVKYFGYSWALVRKLSGEYLHRDFGYSETADATAQVDGEGVDYIFWQGGWLRRQFDDRIVMAVGLATMLLPDTGTMIFGYFVMRPA